MRSRESPARAPRWRGLVGILLFFIALGLVSALGTPLLFAIDERAHLGYALSVAHGVLPTIDTPLAPEGIPPSRFDHRNDVWVANHPPFYYVVIAPVAKLGMALGGYELTIFLVRLASLLFGAAALVFVHATARLMTRGDEQFALLATFVAAANPLALHVCSLVHNDALAILVAAATLHASVAIAVLGYSPGRLTALAVSASLAMLTRFTSIAIVIPACAIATAGLLAFSNVPLGQRVRQGVFVCGVVVVATLATSGWFYARNFELYGDATGGAALFAKIGRTPRGGFLEHALNPNLWRRIHHDLWSKFSAGVRVDGRIWFRSFAWVMLLLGLVGAGIRIRAFTRDREKHRFTVEHLCAIGLAGSLCLVLAAMFAFHARGGTLHARYVLPVLWVYALFLAWGWSALGPRFTRSAIVALCIVNLLIFDAFLSSAAKVPTKHGAVLTALRNAGVGAPGWIFAIILVAIGTSVYLVVREHAACGDTGSGEVPDAEATSHGG